LAELLNPHATNYATGKTSVLLAHGWRKDTSIFVLQFAGCLHREEINLKNVEPFENLAKNVNIDVLCMSCLQRKINIFLH